MTKLKVLRRLSSKRAIASLALFVMLFVNNAPALYAVADAAGNDSTVEAEGKVLSTTVDTIGSKVIFGNVNPNTVYTYPQNEAVGITFTNLPEGDHLLSIEQVETAYGTGYEFLSDLENGTFAYDLQLPNSLNSSEVEVLYSEDNVNFTEVNASLTVNDNTVYLYSVDHFTTYVVAADNTEAAEISEVAKPTAGPDTTAPVVSNELYFRRNARRYVLMATATDDESAIKSMTFELYDASGNYMYGDTASAKIGTFGVDFEVEGFLIAPVTEDAAEVLTCVTDMADNVECVWTEIDNDAPAVGIDSSVGDFMSTSDLINLSDGEDFPGIPVNAYDESGLMKFCLKYVHTPVEALDPKMAKEVFCKTYDRDNPPTLATLDINEVLFGGADKVDTDIIYEGVYAVSYRVFDMAGNSLDWTPLVDIVVDGDITPPVILDTFYYETATDTYIVAAIAEDAASPIIGMIYEFKDVDGNTLASGPMTQLNGPDWNGDQQDGVFGVDQHVAGMAGDILVDKDLVAEVIFCAEDEEGNIGCTTIELDKTAPVVEMDENAKLSYNEGDKMKEMLVNVTDESGILLVCFEYSHTPEYAFGETMATVKQCQDFDADSAPTDLSIDLWDLLFDGIEYADTSVLYEGDYEITYVVIDGAYNVSDDWMPLTTVSVSNVAPEIGLETVAGDVLKDGDVLNLVEGQTADLVGFFYDDPSFIDPDGDDIPNNLGDTPDDSEWYVYAVSEGQSGIYYGTTSGVNEYGVFDYQYNTEGDYKLTFAVCEALPVEVEGAPYNPLSEGVCSEIVITVRVNADTEPSVNITANPGTTVTEESVILTANVTDGNPAYTYKWSGACAGGTGKTYALPSTPGTYRCTVTVTDSDGDIATDTIRVTVNAVPESPASPISPPPAAVQSPVGQGGTVLSETDNAVAEESEETGEAEETEEKGEDVLGELTCDLEITVSGYVYFDDNDNGVKDDDDESVDGVTVKIYGEIDGERRLISSTTTDENGYWETMICPGDYEVEVDGSDLPSNAEVKGDDVMTISVPEEDTLGDVNFILEKTGIFASLKWYCCLIPLVALIAAGGVYAVYKRSQENK